MIIAILSVGFIILLIWLRADAKSANEQLLKERSRIENFDTLINSIGGSEKNFVYFTHEGKRCLKKSMGDNMYKMYVFASGNGNLAVQFFLKGAHTSCKQKFFRFSINENRDNFFNIIITGSHIFEAEVLEEIPEFWGIPK